MLTETYNIFGSEPKAIAYHVLKYFIGGDRLMTKQKFPRQELIECSVITELQAAQVTKICQDYNIQSVIRVKPFVDISQLKKAIKRKMHDRLYDLCPCGKGRKYKFCCYKSDINIEI
jgi:hypothetical protein